MTQPGGDLSRRLNLIYREIERNDFNVFITLCRPAPVTSAGGSLAGTIFGIKDNIAVKGERLTCASRLLENYVSPYDATLVSRLRSNGAVILGKTNMDEFACGSSGENSAFGPALNPLFPGMVPGGSSSGSGAAVAAGLVDAAFGSDTGGSARCPAAFCDAVAFKPTYGRISRHGLVDMAMSLETPAPVVPRGKVPLLAEIMDAVSGYDEHDQTTYSFRRTDCVRKLNDFDFEGADISIPANLVRFCSSDVAAAFRKAVEAMRRAGSTVSEFDLKNAPMLLPSYYITMYSEFSSAMQRFDGLRYGTRMGAGGIAEIMKASRSLLGREVRRRILLGTYITSLEGRSEWYERAVNARNEIGEEAEEILGTSDMIVMPTMPVTPYPFGEKTSDPLLMYATDVLTVLANVCSLPAGSLPVDHGIGIQLIGRRGKDEEVVSAMNRLQGLV
ncbi:MAG: amidase family protein [Candidatus Thermoplasmatota archaeon]|nr:amidase family protein [Candidatus Thermoplasmatota archaeon]